MKRFSSKVHSVVLAVSSSALNNSNPLERNSLAAWL